MPAPVATADVSGAASIAASYGQITSTYRSIAHNRAVGGVANSYHLSGRAIDIARRPGVTHAQIATALQRAGYVMVESLDEGDHSHFAFAGTRNVSSAPIVTLASAKPGKPAEPSPPPSSGGRAWRLADRSAGRRTSGGKGVATLASRSGNGRAGLSGPAAQPRCDQGYQDHCRQRDDPVEPWVRRRPKLSGRRRPTRACWRAGRNRNVRSIDIRPV